MVQSLRLADGSTWGIAAGDRPTSFLVSCLTEAMQLRCAHRSAQQVLVLIKNQKARPLGDDGLFDIIPCPKSKKTCICTVGPADSGNMFALQLVRLSQVICLQAQSRGGVLLHGALAERGGYGVILAGAGGAGKTTATQRLRPPWQSLCDDLTLVVRDEQGIYWVHPWPTWSKFMFGGSGGSWDVQHAAPLRGIFFLGHSHEDHVESIGGGQAVCLLVKSSEQAWWGMSHNVEKDTLQTLRLQRFDNICTLAQAVPCYHLHLSLTGAFWQEIEKAIGF